MREEIEEAREVEDEIFAMLAVINRLLDRRNELQSLARCRDGMDRAKGEPAR